MRSLFALFALLCVEVSAAEFPLLPTPELGKWSSDYRGALKCAQTQRIPLVVVWGRPNCGHCTAFKESVQEKNFLSWQAKFPIYYVYVSSTDECSGEAQEFVLSPKSLKTLPGIALYWLKPDGTEVKVNFSGIDGGMLVKGGTLQLQFKRSLGVTFTDYWGYDPTIAAIDSSYDLYQGVTVPFSFPDLAGYKAKGLPSGIKWNTKVGEFSGTATKSGTFTVSFNKANEETIITLFEVAPFPTSVAGTFNGFICRSDNSFGDFGAHPVGTIAATVASGRITAKVVTTSGTLSFTAKAWDYVRDGFYFVEMTSRSGESLSLALNPSSQWNEVGLEGSFTDAASQTFPVSATRYAFAKTPEAKESLAQYVGSRGFDVVENDNGSWSFVAPENLKKPGITIKIKNNGKVTMSGKIGGYKVNVQTYVTILADGSDDGIALCRGVAFVREGAVKRPLEIWVNLQANCLYDCPVELGGARF